MRRNKMMRAACLLMVLTMITTCSFSGALAKYVVSDYTTDTARVAKFGVVVTATGDLFGPSYGGNGAVKTSAAGNKIQVWGEHSNYVAKETDNTASIVAPGTLNDQGMTFTVNGTPEVSTRIVVDVPEGDGFGEGKNGGVDNADFANTDIYLKTGVYSVMVKVDPATVKITPDNMTKYYKFASPTFTQLAAGDFENGVLSAAVTPVYKRVQMTGTTSTTMADDYYPIDWRVVANGGEAAKVNGANAMKPATTSGSLAERVKTALENGAATHTPNQAWNNTVNVSWKWNFTTDDGSSDANAGAFTDIAGADTVLDNYENTTLRDLEDTILGQMIARAGAAGDGANNTTVPYLISKNASATTETLVEYTKVNATANSANQVILAYTGEAPTAWDAANVACLTVTFGARVTVEQVDYVAPAAP